jgi:3'(2'), 5'-bisphosphate nucleotidase
VDHVTADPGTRRVESADHQLAASAATAAGRLLVELRASGVAGAELGTLGDRRSHEHLARELAAHRPLDAVLSEEGAPRGEHSGRGRVWIVDPLDGTREFTEAGRSDWAVHVALAVDGIPVAGAVALPARDLTLHTGDALARPARSAGPPRLVVSRTRPPAEASVVAARLGAEVVRMGSAGAKAMAVVLGEADVYVHSGGQHEWDSAAPVAVALAAGLHASRLDGSPLVYDQPDAWLPDLVICVPELAADVLAACAGG